MGTIYSSNLFSDGTVHRLIIEESDFGHWFPAYASNPDRVNPRAQIRQIRKATVVFTERIKEGLSITRNPCFKRRYILIPGESEVLIA